MAVKLNHTIVHAVEPAVSARFYSDLLGLPGPVPFGPFIGVRTENDVTLDFLQAAREEFIVEHYAFLVTDAEFDAIFGRIQARGLKYWADPMQRDEGRINRHFGGRGVYFEDPSGHLLEIITAPYSGTGT